MQPTIWDLFNNRAFRAAEITALLQDIAPRPTTLGDLGLNLFRRVNSRTRIVAVAKRNRRFSLVPTSAVGAPPVELEKEGSDVRPFFTRRMAKGSTVYAESLNGILQNPELQQVATLQGIIAQNAVEILDDFALTREHMRIGAVQGKVLDADGVTVLDNWYTNWGVPEPTPFNLHLDVETTALRLICDQIRTAMWNASEGSWIRGQTTVHALAGDELYLKMITHPVVEKTFLNTPFASQLREGIPDTFVYGEITWHRFRQDPTATNFGIPSDEARFFPVGGADVFQEIFGPGEFDPFINQPGQEVIGITIPDRDRRAWLRTEHYSYPLYMCLRPAMLQKAVME